MCTCTSPRLAAGYSPQSHIRCSQSRSQLLSAWQWYFDSGGFEALRHRRQLQLEKWCGMHRSRAPGVEFEAGSEGIYSVPGSIRCSHELAIAIAMASCDDRSAGVRSSATSHTAAHSHFCAPRLVGRMVFALTENWLRIAVCDPPGVSQHHSLASLAG